MRGFVLLAEFFLNWTKPQTDNLDGDVVDAISERSSCGSCASAGADAR